MSPIWQRMRRSFRNTTSGGRPGTVRFRPRVEPLESRTLLTGPADLTWVQQGQVPILLTAPHGGTQSVPDVPVRTSGVRTADLDTYQLADELQSRLTDLLGVPPYVVAAKFHRRYIDANRPPDQAYEVDAAAPYYDYYHDSVRGFVDEIRANYPGGGILLDIHGEGGNPVIVYRGTRNGLTVSQLLDQFGADALVGDASILGGLVDWGYTVSPDTPPPTPPENPSYDGGFTVFTYGSNNDDGIDAIQLEIGNTLRTNVTARHQFVEALAWSVYTYYVSYLDTESAPPTPKTGRGEPATTQPGPAEVLPMPGDGGRVGSQPVPATPHETHASTFTGAAGIVLLWLGLSALQSVWLYPVYVSRPPARPGTDPFRRRVRSTTTRLTH